MLLMMVMMLGAGNTGVAGDATELSGRLTSLCVGTGVDDWSRINSVDC